jgi:hypothetical protein
MPGTRSIFHQVQNVSRLPFFDVALGKGRDYYAFGNSPTQRVPVPTLFIKNLPANQHYLMILTTFSGQENAKEVSTLEPKETVFNETNAWQIPVQDTGQGPFLEELALPAFSRLIASMIRWSLIREGTDPDNDQETLQHHHGWRADIVRIFRPYEKKDVASTPGIP